MRALSQIDAEGQPVGRPRRFPDGFLWGAGTSAYQIEGGIDLDGRGPSIWDTFAAAGNAGGDTGDPGADHRRRMVDDVALIARLGLPAYRFSIAWPRVQPEGAGAVSQPGLDFYRALVDELLTSGIEPIVTLYHWDVPQALEDAGGWPVRDTAGRFADYAAVVAGALGDRVRRWTTINEPWCAAMLGYGAGIHAPGRTEPGAAVAAAHHLLLGHGLAMDALRARVSGRGLDADQRPEIGITLNPYPVVAATSTPETDADRDAVRRIDGIANRLWYDAVLRGAYPDDVLEDLAPVSDLGHIRDGDLAQIARPIDALGLNYYRRYHVRHEPAASAPPSPWPGSPDVGFAAPAHTPTSNGWAVEPDGLFDALVAVAATTSRRRCTSTRAGAHSRTCRAATAACTTPTAGPTSTPTCGRATTPLPPVSTCAGSSCGRCSTTSSGPRATANASASCTSTSPPSSGPRRPAPCGSGTSSPRTACPGRDPMTTWPSATRCTLEDVAARSGVSRATVSRVVNGSTRVSDGARAAVEHAIEQLGYAPNRAARSLAAHRSDTVALAVSEPSTRLFGDPFFAGTIRGIAAALSGSRYQLVLLMIQDESDREGVERLLLRGNTDGVLLLSTRRDDPLPGRLVAARIPCVIAGHPGDRPDASAIGFVDADNVGGARRACAHLIRRGCRTIATVAGPLDMAPGADRLAGWREALGEARRPASPSLVAEGDFGHAGAAAGVRRAARAAPGRRRHLRRLRPHGHGHARRAASRGTTRSRRRGAGRVRRQRARR